MAASPVAVTTGRQAPDAAGTLGATASSPGAPGTTSAAAVAPPARRAAEATGRLGKLLSGWLPPLVVLTGLVVLWDVASRTGIIQPFVLPGPGAVAEAFWTQRDLIIDNAIPTAWGALVGFTVGNTLAVLMAVLFVHSNLAERALFPVAVAFRSIPFVALVPVLVLWLGNGLAPKIFIISFTMFFPTLVNMMRGLRSVDREARELLHSYSANWFQVLVKLRWPASLPFLFAALRIGAGTCFIAALVSEWIGSERGLGYLVVISSSQFEIARLWAAVFVASGLALTGFFTVSLVERRVLRWARSGSALPE